MYVYCNHEAFFPMVGLALGTSQVGTFLGMYRRADMFSLCRGYILIVNGLGLGWPSIGPGFVCLCNTLSLFFWGGGALLVLGGC